MTTAVDLSPLPQAVQASLHQHMQALVQAWAPGVVESGPTGCAHGTPGCAACAILGAAEDVLIDVQEQVHRAYCRTPVEVTILEMLRLFYPSPVTSRQLADRLGLPSDKARLFAYALATLGVIERSSQGHYRYKP